MRKKIYLFSILLFFTSCNDNRVVQEDNSQDSISEIVKELKSGDIKKVKTIKNVSEHNISVSKREKTILQEMGIEFNDNKLIIDINKTNNFFGTLENRIEKQAKNFEQKVNKKIEKIDINMTRDIGIDIKDEEINIDLNKTKNMLDNISHIFETILFESNSTKF